MAIQTGRFLLLSDTAILLVDKNGDQMKILITSAVVLVGFFIWCLLAASANAERRLEEFFKNKKGGPGCPE